MGYLIAGLVVFLGVHSVRVMAEDWRARTIARIGLQPWKGIYSMLSLAGLGLIVYGFDVARDAPTMLWNPPDGMRHATALLTLVAFILITAAYIPGNSLKARWHHPMLLGVKCWAVGHLLANGSVAHVLLFGTFLLWAVVDFVVARRRDRAAGTVYPPGTPGMTLVTVVIGAVAWVGVTFWLHGLLIGISPLG